MDSAVLSWLALAAAAISNGLTVWNFLQSPARKNEQAAEKLTAALGALEQRVGGLIGSMERRVAGLEDANKHVPDKDSVGAIERRIAGLEDAYKHVPDKESFHELKLAIEKMNSDIRVTNQVLIAVKENSNLTRAFVLKNGGGED
jgi:hypothetical protein